MPVRRFWLLLKNVRRLTAQEDLRALNRSLYQNAKKEDIQQFVQELRREVGETHREAPVFDRAGYEELKRMA